MLLGAMPEQRCLHSSRIRHLWVWLHAYWILWTKLHNTYVRTVYNVWSQIEDTHIVLMCELIHVSTRYLQLNSSPGSKCPWSHHPTPSTTFSHTSRVSGTSSTTSRSSGMPSWDTCWRVSISSRGDSSTKQHVDIVWLELEYSNTLTLILAP